MRKFWKSKLLGSLILLPVALVFIGINLLEAKKPEKPNKPGKGPEYTWEVFIPGQNDYDPRVNLFGYSLAGEKSGGTYTDGENKVRVAVYKKKSGKSAESQLNLRISAKVEDEKCAEGRAKIGFQGLDLALAGDGEIYTEEFPCFFPNYQALPDYEALPDHCYPTDNPGETEGFVPYCMKDFLENDPQPFCSIGAGCEINKCELDVPNCVYRYVVIMITLDLDIEAMEKVGEKYPTTGEVWVNVINNYDLLETGYEDWHNVSGLLRRDDSDGSITVVRIDEGAWEITVNARVFTFNEIYKGLWRDHSWEYKIPYWTRTPFKFVTKWTRVQK